MYKNNILSAIMGLILVACLLFLCGTCINDDAETKKREAIRVDCISHLHQAGKAFNLVELQKELAQGTSCLKEIHSICIDDGPGFDEKLEVMQKLQNEISNARNNSFVLDLPKQEALLAKTNRLLFNQGIGCYKGDCQYHTTTFICNDSKRK